MSSRSKRRSRTVPAKQTMAAVETQTDLAVVPYDEHLLERARTQWQFGDWDSLIKLDRNTLQHHPDRAKLALLTAAGHLQIGNPNEGMQYIRLAKDWGCSKKLLLQILSAGVHNSLGRAAARSGQQQRAFKHFEQAIRLGTPGNDARLLTQARAEHQYKLLELHATEQSTSLVAPTPPATGTSAKEYLVTVHLRINNAPVVALGLSTSKTDFLTMQQEIFTYRTGNGAPLYLVSNEDGDFEKSPRNPQIPISAESAYIFSGKIACSGDTRPVVWMFQYAGGKKISAQSIVTLNGLFRDNFKPMPETESFAIGIRLAGNGSFAPNETVFSLQEWGNEALASYLEDTIEKLKQSQQRNVENSMKQIEACMRLQHYLGPDIILPDLHNWPISPDFGVLLINLVEQNNYDAIIEFGSGTSTLILAKALERVGQRVGGAPLLLSFDHLEEYSEKTHKLLKQARLTEHASVYLAPLASWQDESGNPFSHYNCNEALLSFKRRLPDSASKILVVVDGPPAASGRHARYPALPKILEAFPPEEYTSHFLLDDYVRKDEQEIAARWQEGLNRRLVRNFSSEFNNLEKKACLIEVGLHAKGKSE